jgi:hypothetical protein
MYVMFLQHLNFIVRDSLNESGPSEKRQLDAQSCQGPVERSGEASSQAAICGACQSPLGLANGGHANHRRPPPHRQIANEPVVRCHRLRAQDGTPLGNVNKIKYLTTNTAERPTGGPDQKRFLYFFFSFASRRSGSLPFWVGAR